MNNHKYCCQNTTQNFLNHIIPVPDNINVNPDFLYGISENDFINGLKILTGTLKNIYSDIIQNPAEYGLPLIEDIEYSPFNPKAAESKNSSHRLIACVKSTCYNLCKANHKVTVLSDCITSYDKKKIPEMLDYYKNQGSKIISSKDLLESVNHPTHL